METLSSEGLLADFRSTGWPVQEDLLRTTSVLDLALIRPGGSYSPLKYTGRCGPHKVIVKGAVTVTHNLMPCSLADAIQQAKNSEASWYVANGLGMQALVPITVTRVMDLPGHGPTFCSVQYTWPLVTPLPEILVLGTSVRRLDATPLADRRRAALFDVITDQSDRHSDNVLCDEAQPYHLRLFDHDHSFGSRTIRPKNAIIASLPDQDVPGLLLERLEEWLDADHSVIQELLLPQAYDAHIATCQHVLDVGRLEQPPGAWNA